MLCVHHTSKGSLSMSIMQQYVACMWQVCCTTWAAHAARMVADMCPKILLVHLTPEYLGEVGGNGGRGGE